MHPVRRSMRWIALALLLAAALSFLPGNFPAKGLASAPLGITITPTDENGKVTLTPTSEDGKPTLTPTSEPGQPTNTPGHKATPAPRPVVPGGGGNSSLLIFSSLFLIAILLFGASFFLKKPNRGAG